MQFLLAQDRHKTHDWTLIGSDANGIAYKCEFYILNFILCRLLYWSCLMILFTLLSRMFFKVHNPAWINSFISHLKCSTLFIFRPYYKYYILLSSNRCQTILWEMIKCCVKLVICFINLDTKVCMFTNQTFFLFSACNLLAVILPWKKLEKCSTWKGLNLSISTFNFVTPCIFTLSIKSLCFR